jgi:hypothetical protein
MRPSSKRQPTDQAIAACGGNARDAVIVANEYLEQEVCDLMQAVSKAFVRGCHANAAMLVCVLLCASWHMRPPVQRAPSLLQARLLFFLRGKLDPNFGRLAPRDRGAALPWRLEDCPRSVRNGCRGATIVAWLQHRVNI